MNRAAVSIFVFGLYLAAGGLLLLVAPGELCHALGLKPPGETMWVRLSGMFFLDLAFYCIQAAREDRTEFMRWSVWTRPSVLLFLGAFVLCGLENPAVLIFGIVDLLAAIWTATALRADADSAGEPVPSSRRLPA